MHSLLHMVIFKEVIHLHGHTSIINERSELALINLQTSVCSLPSPLPSYQLCLPLSWGMLICMRPAGFCMWATLLSPCCIPLEKVRKRDSRDARYSRLSWIQLPLTLGNFLFCPQRKCRRFRSTRRLQFPLLRRFIIQLSLTLCKSSLRLEVHYFFN